MAKKRAPKRSNGRGPGDGTEDVALDYRHHHARRLNNPTAGNAPEGKVEKADRKVYAYDPHRPPPADAPLRRDRPGRRTYGTDDGVARKGSSPSRPGSNRR